MIWAIGYLGGRTIGSTGGNTFPLNRRNVARQVDNRTAYIVGPAAQVEPTTDERNNPALAIRENATALYRYAGRTAGLAAGLD